MTTVLKGSLHPDFARLADSLLKMLPKDEPGGAALCVYHRGKKVVDIWGGSQDRAFTPWRDDTVAFSASTTKGVISTVMHILVDRGLADYDDKVAEHWPEFGQNGKENITIRHVMTHEAGLYDSAIILADVDDVLDWGAVLNKIELASPSYEPGTVSSYHGLTYGHILGGIIEKIAKKPFQEVLRTELAEPLQLDGLFIGVPDSAWQRCAKIISCDGNIGKGFNQYQKIPLPIALTIYYLLRLLGIDLRHFKKALLPPFIEELNFNDRAAMQAVIPSANGAFTARSLARMYAMIANGGELDGVRILSEATTRKFQSVQSNRRDIVTTKCMNWRLGYHEAFTFGRTAAFGHYGFGGSGAFCDPNLNLAVAMTLNYDLEKPMGNLRFGKFSEQAKNCVKRLEKYGRNYSPELQEITASEIH